MLYCLRESYSDGTQGSKHVGILAKFELSLRIIVGQIHLKDIISIRTAWFGFGHVCGLGE